MTRLTSELQRLFERPPSAGSAADGLVRAMTLTLARPADWHSLSAVWRGVQTDLGLPAPAIAVSGSDAYQLWFSLAEPVPAAQALAFLQGLRGRYLAEVAAERVGLLPAAAEAPPPRQGHNGHWSAFVAPDLAPVFDGEPWLDTPPSDEGQADLLAGLRSMALADFTAALARLGPAAAPAARPSATPSPALASDADQDPRRFLLAVMNDAGVDMALRIEAAKALLLGKP